MVQMGGEGVGVADGEGFLVGWEEQEGEGEEIREGRGGWEAGKRPEGEDMVREECKMWGMGEREWVECMKFGEKGEGNGDGCRNQ